MNRRNASWLHYAAAIALAALAALVRLGFLQTLGTRNVYLTFYPAVILAALFGGLRAGLVASALSAFLAAYFFIEPVRRLTFSDTADLLSLAIFLLNSVIISWAVEIMHRAQSRARDAQAQADLEAARHRDAEARALLGAIVESSDDAIFSMDLKGIIQSWNGAAERLFGYSAAEIIGKPVTLLISSDRLAEEEQIVQRLKWGETVSGFDTVRVGRDGRRIEVSVTVSPLRNSAGELVGASKIVRNLTDRKRIEQALRESESHAKVTEAIRAERQRFYDVLNMLPAYVVLLAPDYHVPFANRFFEERFGRAQGKRCFEYLFNRTEPCENCESYKPLKTHAPHRWEWTGPDGRNYEIHDHSFTDADGSQMVMEMGIDVTEVRKAQAALKEANERLEQRVAERTAALRESQAKLEAALASMTDAVFISDAEGRFLDFNEAFATFHRFRNKQECLKTLAEYPDILEVFLPDGSPAPLEQWAVPRALRGESATNAEYTLRRKDTGESWVGSYSFSPIRDKNGAIVGSVVTGRDITERKKKEEELRRLNRTLNALRHSNEAMMHADREADYLAAVCKIITEDCGHAMVWVGFAERDERQSIRPVAHAGFEAGYLETLRLTWADTERGRGPTGTAIRTGQPCGCPDMHTDSRFAPWRDEAMKRGYASSLAVPLKNNHQAFGAITIYARQPDAFSADETKLLAELADDLAYGITAIRTRQAQAEAEQALRQAEGQSRGELERLVTERTAELRGAFHYARGLLEASLDPLVTISPEGKITDVNQATELATGVPREQLIGSNFSNYFTEPEKAEAGYQKVLADGLVRDYPLTIHHTSGRNTEVLYNATVYRDEAGRVQGVFAAARDITERVAAERRRAITQALLELFAHKASGKEYFDAVVEVIRAWTGCQCLGVRVLDEQGEIPYGASVGFDADFLELENHLSVRNDACLCIRAISQVMEEPDRPLLTSAGSLRCDRMPGFMQRLAPDQRQRYRGTCVKWGFQSIAVIPIRYRDRVLGAIHLADRRPDRFPPATVEFLESMTPLIGEAIQRFHAEAELSRHRDHLEELVNQRTADLEAANRQLRTAEAALQRERDQLEIRVQERTADLSEVNRALEAEMARRQRAEKEHKKLSRRLADAQESERARISRELHDQLGQELTALKLGLRLVKNQGAAVPAVRQSVDKLEQVASGLMQAIHRLAWELHPAVLDDLGLEAALRRYTGEWSEHNQVPVDFHCTGMDAGRLPLELETALYRVGQEALTNILRHAGAKRVSVLLERRPDLVSLIVEDDGAGFDAAAVFQAARSRGKLGLLGMRERITMAGGTIEIESTPGAGTTVFARIPLVTGDPLES